MLGSLQFWARSASTQWSPWAFRSAAPAAWGVSKLAPAQPLPHWTPATEVALMPPCWIACRIAVAVQGADTAAVGGVVWGTRVGSGTGFARDVVVTAEEEVVVSAS